VDDTNTHMGDAYNDELADKGYQVQLIAADGVTLNLTSQEVKRNDALIIAYKRDGGPLPDNQWPLRLVGQTLTKDKMLGKITGIKLNFGAPAPTTTPAPTSTPVATTPAPAGPTVLTVINGSQTKTFSLDQVKVLTPISGYAGTKNKSGVVTSPLPYKGVSLSDLLGQAGGLTASNSVKVTAKDGFSKTFTYDQITKGSFTIYDTTGTAANPETQPILFLAYEADGKALDDATGPLQLAIMTGKNQVTDNSNFVKMVEKIEIVPAG
jgi:DMSO/TMAO reductase YedYZ molybdopterin-dependent catalytic subunit